MSATKSLKMSSIKTIKPAKAAIKVREFSDFAGEPTHVKLQDHLDETLYIVKVEPISSETFGEGFRLHWRDMPNAAVTYTSSVLGDYPVQQLRGAFAQEGLMESITELSPMRVTIRAAGRSYRFE